MHPFAPLDQAEGYSEIFAELGTLAREITGYDAVSLQPNSGSQGEFAGLLAIRAYHEATANRTATSASFPRRPTGRIRPARSMAGMQVVVVKCDERRQHRCRRSSGQGGASTPTSSRRSWSRIRRRTASSRRRSREVCEIVHEHGGQVYLDGANLNAHGRLCATRRRSVPMSVTSTCTRLRYSARRRWARGGSDRRERHLAPYLPGHPCPGSAGPTTRSAPCRRRRGGQPASSPISWAYIAMLGREGLRRSTEIAILSANYMAAGSSRHYPVLYTGARGFVAHECIVDIRRPLKHATGITDEDIAKRLIDYGFHAPTMSFPVAGTLMIEPTESESKAELDRFCDAMISIRAEIEAVRSGAVTVEEIRAPARTPPRRGPADRRLGSAVHAGTGCVPRSGLRPEQVLGSGQPDRQRLSATATSSAHAHRWRPTRRTPPARRTERDDWEWINRTQEAVRRLQVVYAVAEVALSREARIRVRPAVPSARAHGKEVGERLSDSARSRLSQSRDRRVRRDVGHRREGRLVSQHPCQPRRCDLDREQPVSDAQRFLPTEEAVEVMKNYEQEHPRRRPNSKR